MNNEFIECIRNVSMARRKMDEKISKEFALSPIDVGILSFLSFGPEEATATAIEHERKFKKNTISAHVENLVQLGLLERKEEKNDRRKVVLVLTDKANGIVEEWKHENNLLTKKLKEGISKEDFEVMNRCFEIINENALKAIGE